MTATPEKQWRCVKCNCPYYELLTTSIRCAQCGALELTSDHAPTPTPVSIPMGEWTDDDRARSWRTAFDAMHQRAMKAEAELAVFKVTSVATSRGVDMLAELLCETFGTADPGDDGTGKAWPYAREWEKASWRKVAQVALTHTPSPEPRERGSE